MKKNIIRTWKIVILVEVLLVISAMSGRAQIVAPPIQSTQIYKNVFGFGGSVGFPYKQDDVWFWGLNVNYSRVIKMPWSATIGFSYNQTISKPSGEPKSVINDFNLFSGINYSFFKVLTASTGIGKVVISDNNEKSDLKFTDGDWITGIALGISLPDLPFTERDTVGLGISWIWDITKEQPSLGLDLSLGWSF